MAAHADKRAAAGHRPLRGVGRVRTGMALLALHEQDLVLGRLDDLGGLGHGRRVDPVLGVHEELPGALDRGARPVHLFDHALIHQRLRHVLADRLRVALAAEIAGERLFADHVLAGLHAGDDHLRMKVRRRADVDDIELAVRDQLGEAPINTRDIVMLGERDDLVAARSHRRDLDVHAIDAPERIHVQLRHEAAADESHPDPGHSAPLLWAAL
ncbi:hypothetical protein ACVMII_002053 [Bradyrhizobium diazoefficiens]